MTAPSKFRGSPKPSTLEVCRLALALNEAADKVAEARGAGNSSRTKQEGVAKIRVAEIDWLLSTKAKLRQKAMSYEGDMCAAADREYGSSTWLPFLHGTANARLAVELAAIAALDGLEGVRAAIASRNARP